MAPTMAATASSTPTTYLFAASQDWDGCKAAVSTNSGVEFCVAGAGFVSAIEGLTAGGRIGCAEVPLISLASDFGVSGFGTGGAATALGAVGTAGSGAGAAAAENWAAVAARAAGTRADGAEGFWTCGSCGPRSWPRHFFSSHSTHRVRPAETGKPQATHLRRLRKPGGTWLWSGSAGLAVSEIVLVAADQNSGFLEANVGSVGSGC
jgi:hypothetical protein